MTQEVGMSINVICDNSTVREIAPSYNGPYVLYMQSREDLSLEDVMLNRKFSIRPPNGIIRLARKQSLNNEYLGINGICYDSMQLSKKIPSQHHIHSTQTGFRHIEHINELEMLQICSDYAKDGDFTQKAINLQMLLGKSWKIYIAAYPGCYFKRTGLLTTTGFSNLEQIVILSSKSPAIYRQQDSTLEPGQEDILSLTFEKLREILKKNFCNERIPRYI